MLYNKADVARWCKGSTDDSDSSCEGSNPSLAANKKDIRLDVFFYCIVKRIRTRTEGTEPDRCLNGRRREGAGEAYALLF